MRTSAPLHDPTYSIADAAKELGITAGTLRNWIWRRRIGSFRNGRVRIPESEIFKMKRRGWRPAEEEHAH